MAIRNYQKVPGTSASCFWLGFRSIDSIDETSWTMIYLEISWNRGYPQSSSILDWDFPWKPSRGSYGKRWQSLRFPTNLGSILDQFLLVQHHHFLWFTAPHVAHQDQLVICENSNVICYVVYECSKKCDISPSPRSCRSGSPHQLLKVFGLDRWTGTNANKVLYGYWGGWSRINRFMWFYMVLYHFHIWLQ